MLAHVASDALAPVAFVAHDALWTAFRTITACPLDRIMRHQLLTYHRCVALACGDQQRAWFASPFSLKVAFG